MASYYGSGYGGGGGGNQQSGNDGFYSNPNGNYGQQQSAPPPQAFQHSANTQQWTAPQAQTAQQQSNTHTSNTTQPQQPNFWNPAAAATVIGSVANSGLSNDAMIDLASTAGKSFFQSGSARMIPGLEALIQTLRKYFAVDNRYVKRKMIKILFPFVSKHWKRDPSDATASNTPQNYALPTSDENAPDLYLPCMSLITYVLLCALCYGNAGQWSPEVIPDVTTKCIVCQILEVLAIRFGFYMMQAPVSFLDLFAYTGYKYLGLCVNMLIGLLLSQLELGHRGYYVTFLWTASAASYFMLKTMANNIPIITAATGPKREFMVVGFAASQFATMWFVSQTKFL